MRVEFAGGRAADHTASPITRAAESAPAQNKTDNTHAPNHPSSSCLCVCGVFIRFTERRGKKTVRFDGGTNVGGSQEEEWSWEADRQGSQDSATKDSGIDTSSTFTSSEDSNRGDLPKVRGRVASNRLGKKK